LLLFLYTITRLRNLPPRRNAQKESGIRDRDSVAL